MNKSVDKLITHKTEWHPLKISVGGAGMRKFSDLRENFGTYGVYQIAHKDNLPVEIVDGNIGYSGRATNVFHRANGVKTKKGKHQCRVYLSSKGIDISEIYIRYLFTEEGKESELETLIHNETESKYKYRFAWREASGGQDGAMLRVLDMIDKVENIDDLKLIAKTVRDKAIEVFENNWLSEIEED
jgi:hypothetical protein